MGAGDRTGDRKSDVLDIDTSTRGTADLNPVNHRRSV
jgi:hypothetical protein